MIPRFKPWLGWAELFALFKRNKGAVERFEKEFAKKFKAVDAIAFPYGRSAQWAFFNAVGIEGNEIIMPAYTCSVVAHAVSLSGNTPHFVDINLCDYNMNLDLIPDAISENTRAIIATHTFGYPQDLEQLEKIVKDAEDCYGHKIWLMQDCCHAFGAEWKGRMVGTSGDVAVYAFNISKIMTSIFGGMLTFQDQDLANKVRAWRDENYKTPGFLKSIQRRLYLIAVYVAFNKSIYGVVLWLQEKTKLLDQLTKAYHLDNKIHFPPDYLQGMLDVEAAVGLEQLRRYSSIVERRQKIAHWYDRNIERREEWVFPPIVAGATYSHYVIRVPDRKEVVKEWVEYGIQLGVLIEYSIPTLIEYKENTEIMNVHSEKASQSMINLPVTQEPKALFKEVNKLIEYKVDLK
jgi:perosamine synthetase